MRVATSFNVSSRSASLFATAHSCGLRPCAGRVPYRCRPLPQRIRAGCDKHGDLRPRGAQLCHSAFARVATYMPIECTTVGIFATAHSCGLRRFQRCTRSVALVTLPQRIRAGCDAAGKYRLPAVHGFATAHSCGLRLQTVARISVHEPLPQRIRAGCDDYIVADVDDTDRALPQRIRAGCDRLSSSTSMRVTIFATAHSRGLRQWQNRRSTCRRRFATVHSRGLRLTH